MAPRNEDDSMKAITSDRYFESVDARGYPVIQNKKQPWIRFIKNAPKETKRPESESEKMLVVCSMKHDYGSTGLGGY